MSVKGLDGTGLARLIANIKANFALKSQVPTKVSDLSNDSGFLTSYTETDPTVPSWAKASSKPTYTASEVGAAASSHNHAASDINSGTLASARLPIATANDLGGIKVGSGLSISDGVLSAISNGASIGRRELWSNSNSSNTFAAQTVTQQSNSNLVGITNYLFISIGMRDASDSSSPATGACFIPFKEIYNNRAYFNAGNSRNSIGFNSIYNYSRVPSSSVTSLLDINIQTGAWSMLFGEGYRGTTKNAKYCIPLEIVVFYLI